jgi:hypothetical protein
MSTPKSTATSKVTKKYTNISPLRTAVPTRGKKRKMEETTHSDNDGDSTVDEGAQVKEEDTHIQCKPGSRKNKCVRAGTQTGMASPISKSRSFKSIREAGHEAFPEFRFDVAAPRPQSIPPTSPGFSERDIGFSDM